ncbi:MAG: nucleotide sugar dehydrogenase [Thermoplasmata archaeon]
MNVCVVGLGYVGLPLACAFANAGIDVIGIDIDEKKVLEISRGICPIKNEPGLQGLLHKVLESGKFSATSDFGVCRKADAVIVCVQTPVVSGKPDYTALCYALGSLGRRIQKGVLVVIESTIMPGTMEKVVKPALEKASGMVAGREFHLVHVPERVTPGRLLLNLEKMPRVIGGNEEEGIRKAVALYKHIVQAEIDTADWITAETTKVVENTYRDVQIAFANEVACICEHLGVDFLKLRELVNKVPYRDLHMAGAGVGGHCIPKDPWLLVSAVEDVYVPELTLTARRINEGMPAHVVELVMEAVKGIEMPIIALLGYAYREESDDARNTPAEPVRKKLLEIAKEVRVHDPYVENGFIEHDLCKVIEGADAVVLITAHKVYRQVPQLLERMRHRIIVDARAFFDDAEVKGCTYIRLGRGKMK